MAELNFVVDQTALETVKNTQLTANFDEMKEALTEFIEPYTQLIVSEDAIAEAKADRAKINAVAKHVDDYRKLVKKVYTEPLKQFEDKCKELTAICDKGKSNIDYQLSEFEEKRKQEKYELLKEHYETACGTMVSPEYISFELALHPKWENKTTSLEECQKYMDEAMQKVDTEVKTIRNLHSEWETSLLNEYQKTHDLLAVLGLNEQLTKRAELEAERKRKAQEEYEREQAELKRQQEEAKKAVAEAAKETNWEEVPQNLEDLTNPLYGAGLEAAFQQAINADQGMSVEEEKEPEYDAVFRVHGTLNEITVLRNFMDQHGFEYACDSMNKTQ